MLQESEWLIDVFLFFTVDFQPRVLSGWIVGRNARHMETLSDQVVTSQLYNLLKRFYGKKYEIPEPISMIRSRWHSDEHIRGWSICLLLNIR